MRQGAPSPRQLLVLLLLSQGYSLSQVAAMLGTPAEKSEELAQNAARTMGTADWHAAAGEARRRGLI